MPTPRSVGIHKIVGLLLLMFRGCDTSVGHIKPRMREYIDVNASARLLNHFRRETRGAQRAATSVPSSDQWHRSFHDLDEINLWMAQMAAMHPRAARVFSIGNSYEGRPIRAMRVSIGAALANVTGTYDTDIVRPVIVVDACIHAREWISCAAAQVLIERLLDPSPKANLLYSVFARGHDAARAMLVDVIVVPVLNVDGYAFSRTSLQPGISPVVASMRRNQRTNRQLREGMQSEPGEQGPNNMFGATLSGCCAMAGGTPCFGCYSQIGTDISRNFPVGWQDEENVEILASNPRADNYRGQRPLDAPEAAALAQLLRALNGAKRLSSPNNTSTMMPAQGKLMGYLNTHAYGPFFMTPFGYTKNKKIARDAAYQKAFATKLATRLHSVAQRHQCQSSARCEQCTYLPGTPWDTIQYTATGLPTDYAYESLGVKLSFVLELRTTACDHHIDGFLELPGQILNVAADLVATVALMIGEVAASSESWAAYCSSDSWLCPAAADADAAEAAKRWGVLFEQASGSASGKADCANETVSHEAKAAKAAGAAVALEDGWQSDLLKMAAAVLLVVVLLQAVVSCRRRRRSVRSEHRVAALSRRWQVLRGRSQVDDDGNDQVLRGTLEQSRVSPAVIAPEEAHKEDTQKVFESDSGDIIAIDVVASAHSKHVASL